MDWPAYSPDLNPIEHVWDDLGRRIAARLHHPENTHQLKQMLIEAWVLLPQEMLHQLVLSMRRRCEATIAVRGGEHNGGSVGGTNRRVAIHVPILLGIESMRRWMTSSGMASCSYQSFVTVRLLNGVVAGHESGIQSCDRDARLVRHQGRIATREHFASRCRSFGAHWLMLGMHDRCYASS
ncbi:transposable element Tcb2 transposase [Trichonephila clavipes]|nr:transposable element Tcb2 transposase [Trichonephila clavipes]